MSEKPVPTMEDAIAAGNGTLHGAIDYWQEQASRLKAERDEAREALRNLTTRTEEFWAFLRGEYGIRLSAEDGDDHNVVEFFIAMDRARALLARVEEGKR